eukprot:UN27066
MSDDSFNRRPSADIVDSILRTDGSTSDKTSDMTAHSPKYDIKITIKKDLVRLSNKFDKFDFGGLADDDSEHLDSKRSPEAASKRSPESSSDKRDKWRALANKSGTLPTIKVSRSRSERATLSPTGSDGGFPRSLSEKTPPPVPGSLQVKRKSWNRWFSSPASITREPGFTYLLRGVNDTLEPVGTAKKVHRTGVIPRDVQLDFVCQCGSKLSNQDNFVICGTQKGNTYLVV